MRNDHLQGNAHFNLIKMHLPTHYKSHVERLGAIPACSTELGENAHCIRMKTGYRSSNRQDYELQLMAHTARVGAIGMRKKKPTTAGSRGALHYVGLRRYSTHRDRTV